MDSLKFDGNVPETSERLTMLVIVGTRTGKHFFKREVGIGSRSHCLSGEDLMSCVDEVATSRPTDVTKVRLRVGASMRLGHVQ